MLTAALQRPDSRCARAPQAPSEARFGGALLRDARAARARVPARPHTSLALRLPSAAAQAPQRDSLASPHAGGGSPIARRSPPRRAPPHRGGGGGGSEEAEAPLARAASADAPHRGWPADVLGAVQVRIPARAAAAAPPRGVWRPEESLAPNAPVRGALTPQAAARSRWRRARLGGSRPRRRRRCCCARRRGASLGARCSRASRWAPTGAVSPRAPSSEEVLFPAGPRPRPPSAPPSTSQTSTLHSAPRGWRGRVRAAASLARVLG